MSWTVLTGIVALATFAAGWLAGRASRRTPPIDAAIAAENADLRRRMDELANALIATDKGANS